MVKVMQGFHGVKDGEVYPKWIGPGTEVTGSLAQTVIDAGWDKPAPEGEASPPMPATPEPAAQLEEAEKEPEGPISFEVSIPSDWEKLQWPQLRSKAAEVVRAMPDYPIRKIANLDEAKAAIRAYIDRTAAPAEEQA